MRTRMSDAFILYAFVYFVHENRDTDIHHFIKA